MPCRLIKHSCAAVCLLVCGMRGAVPGGQIQAPVQPPAAGQNTGITRSIEGYVLDKSKQPIPNAIVLIKDTKTLQVRSYIARADGRYHFSGLSTEVNYQVRAQAKGLTSKTKMVSVFDSHRVVKLNLKVYRQLNR